MAGEWGPPVDEAPAASKGWGAPMEPPADDTVPEKATFTSGDQPKSGWGSPEEAKPPEAKPPMPGVGTAFGEGLYGGYKDLKQTVTAFSSAPPVPDADTTAAAQPYEMNDLWEPSRGLAKTAYRVGKSAPVIAGGVLGAAVTRSPTVGGATGAGLMATFQAIGPVFAEELKKTPDDPDGAWNRSLQHAATSGIFSALGWAAFPLKAFQGPLKNLAFQAFGVQPAIGVTEHAVQNTLSDKPLTEGMGNAYVESAIGTAVPALGHKIVEGAKPPVAPQRLPIQDQLLQSAQQKQQMGDQLRSLAEATPNTDDALKLRMQADEVHADAAHERFLGNMADPIKRDSSFRDKVKTTWIDTFQPELMSDKALLGDAQTAKYKSERAQLEDSIMHRADEHRYDWNKVPQDDVRRFLEYYETPENQRSPQLKAEYAALEQRFPFIRDDAPLMQKWLKDSYFREQELGSKAEFIMNYFPHLFEGPAERVQQLFANSMAIQGQGPSWFQKARYYDLIEHALNNGLELKSYNPIDLVSMRLLSGADMQAKSKLLQQFHQEGMAVPKEQAPPWVMSPMKTGALPWQEIGAPNGQRWMIAPDVQPLWKNGVEAKGLWANQGAIGDAFRGWMGLKSAWVPVKLGLSMFHPVHVAHISIWNNLNRGIQEAIGKGQQTMWDRTKAIPEAVVQTVADAALAFPWGVPFTNIKLPPSTHIGKEIREAWATHPEAQTTRQQELTKVMNEAGVSAQLSEQLRTAGKRQFWDAVQKGTYLSSPWEGAKTAGNAVKGIIGALSKPIFEHWIPNLKTAAVLRETESLYRRRPDIMNDPNKRAIAMRAIGKQIDNRFGEMFYGSLFWNRTLKDASIGSFLSLGWNLGFAREFVGGALEPAARRFMAAPTPNRQIIRDVTTKASNAFGYTASAMIFNAIMNKGFTGDNPQDIWDLVFPRIGGLNPDGSPRRVTNAFYTREVPMAMKHIEEAQSIKGGLAEMVKNKLMFAPFIEMISNHNYFGNQIWDPNAPYLKQWQQMGEHILSEQISPMSVTGAKRALQLSGKPFTFKDVIQNLGDRDVVMPALGFGPAPAYASRDPIQNRIMHLARQYVYPNEKPFVEAEKMKERGNAVIKYKQAQQSGDQEKIAEAAQELAKQGMKTAQIRKIVPGQEVRNAFQRLGSYVPSQQVALLKEMSPEQFKFYYPVAAKKVKADPEIQQYVRRYYPQ